MMTDNEWKESVRAFGRFVKVYNWAAALSLCETLLSNLSKNDGRMLSWQIEQLTHNKVLCLESLGRRDEARTCLLAELDAAKGEWQYLAGIIHPPCDSMN